MVFYYRSRAFIEVGIRRGMVRLIVKAYGKVGMAMDEIKARAVTLAYFDTMIEN